MNVRDYEYIVEIAAQGSISRTAYRLSITPGALSHKRTCPCIHMRWTSYMGMQES